jgi:hypothetical protein
MIDLVEIVEDRPVATDEAVATPTTLEDIHGSWRDSRMGVEQAISLCGSVNSIGSDIEDQFQSDIAGNGDTERRHQVEIVSKNEVSHGVRTATVMIPTRPSRSPSPCGVRDGAVITGTCPEDLGCRSLSADIRVYARRRGVVV